MLQKENSEVNPPLKLGLTLVYCMAMNYEINFKCKLAKLKDYFIILNDI